MQRTIHEAIEHHQRGRLTEAESIYLQLLRANTNDSDALHYLGVLRMSQGKPQEAHYYFPGQRRVRRMPTYSYDSPQIGMDNQLNVDESYMFSGPMDRFDWKLAGKKELIVPYNVLGMYDFTAKADEMMLRDAPSLKVVVRAGTGMRYPSMRARGWHSPGVIGVFGSATAASLLLRLERPG